MRYNATKKEILAKYFGKKCSTLYGYGCGKEFKHLNELTKDHVVPRWKGGSNELDNLQLLCWECHQKKNKLYDSRTMSPVPYMFGRYIEVMNGYKNGKNT